ncbi:MAG: diguanylate cyclase [Burkholderiales bacterium]
MGAELIQDMRAVLAAWRQFSPVVVGLGDRIHASLMLRYADASLRNARLQLIAFALVLFGVCHQAPLLPRVAAFGLLTVFIVFRLFVTSRLAARVRAGSNRTSLLNDACAMLTAVAWGATPLLLAPYLPPSDFYALSVISIAVLSMISVSYLSALPASIGLVLAMMVPMIYAFVGYGTQVSVSLAIGTAVFGFTLLARLRVSHRTLIRMLEAEQQNASLVTELHAYRRRLERENEELGNSLRNASEAALRDPLTGAFNRHYLAAIAQLADRVRERHEAITVCMIDVDHFKRINDRFGHTFGDEVLKAVVKQLSGRLREGDSLARYGGEEFVVILRGCEINRARRVAEALRHNVASLQIDTRSGPLMVTASIGVARWGVNEDITQVMQRADRAMYGAKQAGRDRVEIDPIDARDLHSGPEDTTWPARVTQT